VPESKYQPLADFLAASAISEHTLTFRQIELILGSSLPDTATHPPDKHQWWANDRTHSQARAWLGVGWQRGRLDPAAGIVTFVRGAA
jgi:hypothetical protein